MPTFRVVADNSTVVSGLLWRGPSERVLRAARDATIELIASRDLFVELEGALSTADTRARLREAALSVPALLQTYRSMVTLIEPASVSRSALRDAKDLIVLAAAVGGQADIVVTGDKDLLILKTHELIAILSPVQLLYTLGRT